MSSLIEKDIEQTLVKKVKAMGGICPKWVSPGKSGVPDRIILLPGKHVAFVELKRPGKNLRELQKKRKRELESLGFSVFKVDEKDQIKEVLDEIQST